MRKTSLFAALVLALGAAACQRAEEPAPAEEATETTEVTEAPAMPAEHADSTAADTTQAPVDTTQAPVEQPVQN